MQRPNRCAFTSLLFLLVFVLPSPHAASQDLLQLIHEGDEYSEKKFDNAKALELYLKAAELSPNNYEILWRLSKVYVDIGEHMPDQTDQQKDAQLKEYMKAVDYADQAIKANEKGMMGYLRRAIANGRVALFKGVFSVIGLVKDVRKDLEKAIALKNGGKRQIAIAHYVLGRTHDKVCEKPYLLRLPLGLGWGDREIAATEYEEAVKIDPDFIMFRLDAARNYIEMEEYQKAKRHLYKIPYLPRQDEDDERFRQEAAGLLETIKSK